MVLQQTTDPNSGLGVEKEINMQRTVEPFSKWSPILLVFPSRLKLKEGQRKC